jgi:hypothetical protein
MATNIVTLDTRNGLNLTTSTGRQVHFKFDSNRLTGADSLAVAILRKLVEGINNEVTLIYSAFGYEIPFHVIIKGSRICVYSIDGNEDRIEVYGSKLSMKIKDLDHALDCLDQIVEEIVNVVVGYTYVWMFENASKYIQ